MPLDRDLVTIPDEIYREACVSTTEEPVASCWLPCNDHNASWGGGGKGIRKVCSLHVHIKQF